MKSSSCRKFLGISVFFLLILFTGPVSGDKQYGLLKLEVKPSGAAMIVDGRYLDQDVWLISIKPGKHQVAIMKKGFKPFFKDIEIKSGARVTLNVVLAELDSLTREGTQID